ncbi:MAG: AAA family ATPase [Candidatus Magasanikbacteria bacterium]|nr:AAA family ATPase [Candidatus Magasanikbacteria bacterium]
MHVKRMEINGFKSFAQSTVFEFSNPVKNKHGVTVIVGPNGSGKSNVADAIRWVLGEQSMKHLRGKKSEDIIFAGSQGKAKMSMASVTMVLDNTDKRAPIEYDELIIARRLYRSGESEYLLNGNAVRLIDLQILLAQAQFGQGSYSIIGQGAIDRLLLQTPAERKSFFDEAVGIKEFQIKRHHAAMKMKRTEENIAQATVLLQEIEPRLKSLKRQVSKLEKRQEVEISLRELQEQYYFTLHTDLTTKVSQYQAEFDEVCTHYIGIEKFLHAVQTELAELAQEKSRHEIFESLQKEYTDVQEKKNNLERDHAIVAGKLQTEFSKAGKQNIGWLENKIEEFKKQDASISVEIESEQGIRTKVQQQISQTVRDLEALQQKKIYAHSKFVELDRQIAEIRQGKDGVQFEGLRAVNAILSQTDGVFGGKVYGIVAQLAQVDEKYRLALEVAAHAHLSSVVVEDDHVAQACIEFLKKQQLGFATFLPLNKIQGRIVPRDVAEMHSRLGVHGLATELVNYNSIFDSIFSYVFGSTLVVDDIETAREIGIGRVRMVTLEGDIMETSGSMKGGFRRKNRGVLSFAGTLQDFGEHALENLEKEIQEHKTQLEKIELEIESLREILSTYKTQEQVVAQKVSMIDVRKNEIARELASLSQELMMYSISPDQYGEMMQKFNIEKEQIVQQIKTSSAQLEAVYKKIEALNVEEEKKRQRIFFLQDEMQTRQQELNTVGDKKHTVQVEITRLETHREDLEQEIFSELRSGVGSILDKGLMKLGHDRVDHAKVEIEKLKYQLSLIGGIDEDVMGEYEETKTRYESLDSELNDLGKASHDLNKMIDELDTLMKKKHSESFAKIKKEFARYFKILFEGGEAELVEIYGSDEDVNDEITGDTDTRMNADDADNADTLEDDTDDEKQKKKRRKKILQGVEVYACPPGKKIKNITALSGGERTMTSIALLSAILHTNPSPFVLLDEVEAALDEANTLRFTKILHELAEQSQFIIITHNRVTMHVADLLYGVTMGNDGMSKLVSVKLDGDKG